MPKIGKRISPPEGVETKVGDIVKYELLFDDGSVGTMTTRVGEFVPTDKYNEEEQPTTQEEKHGMLWKFFWSLVLGIILIGTSSLCVAFTCYVIGDSFDIQTLAYSVLFSTVWLVSYILIDKNE